MSEFSMPTEVVELPSRGLLYPESNPLSSGKIEMKYMTAKEEDILTNQSYIENGTVIDRILKSLIVSKINYDDLVVGDKNAVLVAARVLGYGADYSFTYNGKPYSVDLSKIENKPFDESLITPGVNEFKFTLPSTGTNITFKILTHRDEEVIKKELDGYKKIDKDASPELSTRLKYMITSVEGNKEAKTIREFVDTGKLLARDSRALRSYISQVQPDTDLNFYPEGSNATVAIPVGISFFWPDA
jgi:uncharacterized protein YwgA